MNKKLDSKETQNLENPHTLPRGCQPASPASRAADNTHTKPHGIRWPGKLKYEVHKKKYKVRQKPGGHSPMAPPGPIPNPEVKHWSVDGSRTIGPARVDRRQCLKRRAPQSVNSAGLVDPGSYLLSRDLSSDYHRRADVSLPGSEWDRVGPSGYDHQVSGSFSLLCSLLTSVIICACGFLVVFLLAAGCWQQADIRVAYGFSRFPLFLTLTPLHLFQAELLVTGVFV